MSKTWSLSKKTAYPVAWFFTPVNTFFNEFPDILNCTIFSTTITMEFNYFTETSEHNVTTFQNPPHFELSWYSIWNSRKIWNVYIRNTFSSGVLATSEAILNFQLKITLERLLPRRMIWMQSVSRKFIP